MAFVIDALTMVGAPIAANFGFTINPRKGFVALADRFAVSITVAYSTRRGTFLVAH